MLPVYICEDDEKICLAQKEFLENLILMEGYDMEIVLSTCHPYEVIQLVSEKKQRGIYFLDVELKGESMDGFALGQKIRELDTRGFYCACSWNGQSFRSFHCHDCGSSHVC